MRGKEHALTADVPARLLSDPSTRLGRGWVAWPLELASDEGPIRLAAVDGSVRLADLVPVARALATRLACNARRSAKQAGVTIPCRKGCAACCSSLVPLSIAEAFRLIEDLQAVPLPRRQALLAAFQVNARRVVEAGPPELPPELPASTPAERSHAVEATGRWYNGLELDCPFLVQNLCTLYSQRPLACREHMVRTDESACEGFQPCAGETLQLPVSALDMLVELVSELEGEEPEAVMMPVAVEWARMHPRRAERTWPAKTVFGRFVEMLQDASDVARRSAVA
jgi:Fe-S-cluster containining protein